MRNDPSTTPDAVTGCQQKQTISKLKQFPLIFMNPSIDAISKSLTSFGNPHIFRVVYMGPRHNSNMKAFKAYCHSQSNPNLKESQIYGLNQMNKFIFHHRHQNQIFFPIRTAEYRLFTGMNPTSQKDDLRFDSDFQCGNLDLAIYINPVEYDLVMRVDSNTKGHTSWFYFKVSNAAANQKIKFNIINFNKRCLSYKDGMKPYVYKKSNKQWTQIGISILFGSTKPRYKQSEETLYGCLSFIYQFKDTEQVYFAYCVPYSYSFLLHRLESFKIKAPNFLKISYECQSSGGLPIPVVTITNFNNNSENKVNALCIGRLHPGQTQGSWMIDGFINQLISPQSHYLRDKMVFKIVPMVNVDGVVLGNFRTGILGRDLNRCFNIQRKYNEITLLRRMAAKNNPQIFLDFHGHSAKKNVFIYGPDYKLQDRDYVLCRVFPKIISKEAEAFRYYACSFHISQGKAKTGRAIMLRQFRVEYSYTIEASAYSYGPMKNEKYFNSNEYLKVGHKIAVSLNEFLKIIKVIPKIEQNKIKSSQRWEQSTQLRSSQYLSSIQKSLINQIIKDQVALDKQDKFQNQSDSDCEDSSNDYSNTDICRIMEAKFEPKALPKDKSETKLKNSHKSHKNKKEKRDTSIEANKNTIQLIPPKLRISRNKSYIRKRDETQFNTSSIIEISSFHNNFETVNSQTTKIIQSHPTIVNRVLKKKQRSRLLSDSKQLRFRSIFEKRNDVMYDWSDERRETEKSSKHFHFELPESIVDSNGIVKQKQGQGQQKIHRKKIPLLSIKKTVFPSLGRSTELPKQGQIEKSMLSQILQSHERKTKDRKELRIMFL